MAVAAYHDGRWSEAEIKPVAPIELSPAAHVLHYASTCFEGFKAFRRADGSIHMFRMDRHIQRMRQSARQLVLPEPNAAQLADMVRAVIARCRDAVPEAPGALYLRPILFGTTANIGAAATPASDALLLVLASPVWDYFAGGMKPLRILVDDENTRSRGADGHGQDRRQLRRGDGPDARCAGEIPGRSSAVLSGRPGAGDRCGQFSADSRRRALDARAWTAPSCTASRAIRC